MTYLQELTRSAVKKVQPVPSAIDETKVGGVGNASL